MLSPAFYTRIAALLLTYVLIAGGMTLYQHHKNSFQTMGWFKGPSTRGENFNESDKVIYTGEEQLGAAPVSPGLLVYLFSLVSSGMFVYEAQRTTASRKRALLLSGAIVNLVIFGAFLYCGICFPI